MFALVLMLLTLTTSQSLTVPNLPLPKTISLGGAFTTDQAAFGFTSSNAGNVATAAATGGMINTATVVSGPSPTDAPTLSPINRYVPDYRDAGSTPTQTSATTATKRKVKVWKRPTPAPQPHQKVCWQISKNCCYEQVQKGYKCRDYYVYKYARCHPVIEYEQICGEIIEQPKHHPKPDGRVLYEESVIKNYDSRYGPHVEGYPEGGESEFYDSPVIPQRPHGVTADPYDPPVEYQNTDVAAPRPGNASQGSYQGAGTHGRSYGNAAQTSPSSGGGITSQTPPASGSYAPPAEQQTSPVSADSAKQEPNGAYQGGNPPAAPETATPSGPTYRFAEPAEELLR